MTDQLSRIAYLSRLVLGAIFIFHGLVPKILWLSDIEVSLVNAGNSGLSAQVLSPIAGIAEILLGLLIMGYRKSVLPIYLAALSLVSLLGYVAMFLPSLLIEAFNPMTTNLPAIFLCYLIVSIERHVKAASANV